MALRGTLTHRKTRRLAKLLGIPAPCALGVLEALWHATYEHQPTGAIGLMSNQDIADEIFWEDDADALIDALIQSGWLDEDSECRLAVHGWWENSDDATHMKVARAHEVFTCGSLPRLRKFGGAERAQLEQFYAQSVRTESAPPLPSLPDPDPDPDPGFPPTPHNEGGVRPSDQPATAHIDPPDRPAEYRVLEFFDGLSPAGYPNLVPSRDAPRFCDHLRVKNLHPADWKQYALGWARNLKPDRDVGVGSGGEPRTFSEAMRRRGIADPYKHALGVLNGGGDDE